MQCLCGVHGRSSRATPTVSRRCAARNPSSLRRREKGLGPGLAVAVAVALFTAVFLLRQVGYGLRPRCCGSAFWSAALRTSSDVWPERERELLVAQLHARQAAELNDSII